MRMVAEQPKKQAEQPQSAFDKNIPRKVLSQFLDEKISLKDVIKIQKVTDKFLWESGGYQRYRINVWMVEEIEHSFCERNYIGHSWFVHFDVAKNLLIDMTIEPKPQEKAF